MISYIKLFSDTLLSFTASVGPELSCYTIKNFIIVPNFWPVLYTYMKPIIL